MMYLRPDLHAALDQAIDPFKAVLALKGQVVRAREGRCTLYVRLREGDFFVKIHRGIGWKEIGKNLLQLRLPVVSARNEWQALRRLPEFGIATPTLVGYGIRGHNPARLQSFVITEALEHTVTLEILCQPWLHNPPRSPAALRLKRVLIKKVAQIARLLHSNGINHRDFYLCHFRLQVPKFKQPEDLLEQGEGDIRLYLMDLHRAQMRRHTPRRWIIKDIGSLYFSALNIGLTRRDLLRFMRVYRNCSMHKVIQERGFWRAVQHRAQRLQHRAHEKTRS